jgi:PBP1b-binding outer membrane lipoprotein LpoB
MKRIVCPIILGLILLVGCQNSEPKGEIKPSTEQNQQKASTKTETNATFPLSKSII